MVDTAACACVCSATETVIMVSGKGRKMGGRRGSTGDFPQDFRMYFNEESSTSCACAAV